MSSTAVGVRYTPQQYLALERQAEAKSEYRDGEIVPMPGASEDHSAIAANLIIELGYCLRRRVGKVYTGDLRVRATNLYTYPDVTAVREEAQLEDDRFDTLLNPALIAEVLSPSTEAYDRGEKFAMYRQIGSLQDYVLIAQDAVRVELHTRRGNGWDLFILDRLDDVLRLESIGCEVPLAEIYNKTALAAGRL